MSNCVCQKHQNKLENHIVKHIKETLIKGVGKKFLLLDTTTSTDAIAHISLMEIKNDLTEKLYQYKHLNKVIIEVKEPPKVELTIKDNNA